MIRTLAATLALAFVAGTAAAQNVVASAGIDRTAPAVDIPRAKLERFIRLEPAHEAAAKRVLDAPTPISARLASKLERHVTELLDAFPLRPFHCTLGISGHETYFDHPDETFWALSTATPYLSPKTAVRVRAFLEALLELTPPYAIEGFDTRRGARRERYIVPDSLRSVRARAPNAFGVHAYWSFVKYAGDAKSLDSHLPRVVRRMETILARAYRFDIGARHERDEAERFSGDLAGTIALARIARIAGDDSTLRRAIDRATQMLALRINLERTNAEILEPTRVSASKGLHNAKLARYVDLTPAVGRSLAELTDGVAAARLRAFREARNGWHIAFGPRLIGGENYTSPPHLSRALFDTAVLVEKLPPASIAEFVDIPWCRGDLYFIAKCAFALWSLGGRPWKDSS